MNFTLGHVQFNANPYYGPISVPKILCNQQEYDQFLNENWLDCNENLWVI